MTIQVGDRLPAVNLKQLTADGIKDVPITELTKGKKVVLFAVPGAFTPTCSRSTSGLRRAGGSHQSQRRGRDPVRRRQRPLRLERLGESQERRWQGEHPVGRQRRVHAIRSGSRRQRVRPRHRSKRYAMVVEDGVVKALKVEDARPARAEKSSAAAIGRPLGGARLAQRARC